MTNTVTFPPAVGGDGSTVTDDSNATTGLANGGFRTRLLPMFTQIIAIANWILGTAAVVSTNAENASNSAMAAATSASTALNAPGTNATSTTSLTIGAGSQSLTVQGGKLFVAGMYVTVASTASPSNVMTGPVSSYDGSTGALVVNSVSTSGSGAFSAWTIAVSGAPGANGAAGPAGPVLPYIHVREQQAVGTNAGSSVSGTQTRVLNTVVTNTIAGASLASNQITLPAGTYRVQASAPASVASGTQFHQASLYNVTDSSNLVTGSSDAVAGEGTTRSVVIGSFVLSATKAISVRHSTSPAVANLGLGISSAPAGSNEVYTEVEITKVA